MSVYFIGDPHLGHRNISKFRPWVRDSDHNTQMFVDQWTTHINKNDVVYFMGDAAFDDASLDIIRDLRGRKILIKGNHDDFVSTKRQAEVFEEIHGMLKYKSFWLTHCPIHMVEMRGKKANIHGHVHKHTVMKKNWYGKKIVDPRYVNTCVDVVFPQTGRYFLSLDQVKSRFS